MSLRYLGSKKINFFPISGVAVGVMVLTVIMSVMNGFVGQMRERIRGTLSDLIVSKGGGTFPQADIVERLNRIPHVVASSPRLEGLAFFRMRNVRRWGLFEGIDPDLEKQVGSFQEYVGSVDPKGSFASTPVPPEFRMGVDPKGEWPIIVTRGLLSMGGDEPETADYVQPGESVTVYTLVGIDEHSLKRFKLCASFKSGMSEYDSQYVYIPLDLAQRLRKTRDMITSVYVKVDAPEHAEEVRWTILYEFHKDVIENALKSKAANAEALEAIESKLPEGLTMASIDAARDDPKTLATLAEKLPEGLEVRDILFELQRRDAIAALAKAVETRDSHLLRKHLGHITHRPFDVQTWEEKRFIILRAVAVEKKIQAVILSFIIVVAGFMVFAILHMIVVEKTKDIGILKALGGTPGGIMSIFLLNGLAIGVIGSVLGSILGVLFTRKLNWLEDIIYARTGWRVFPPDVYYFDKIPWVIEPWSVFVCALSAIVVSLLASLYPAWRAARLDPVQTLRYE